MSEQHPLPIVTESDMLLVLTDDAIDGQSDPYHKQWFGRFRDYNPILAGEILKQASEDADGDPDNFNRIIRVVSYTIHALEKAGERLSGSDDKPS